MKVGDLLLNWQKKPVAILLCNESNKVFWFESRKHQRLSNAQKKALFFSEDGLQGVNLNDTDLADANLKGVNLRGASLYCASLYCANLSDSNLSGCNLEGANLHYADLTGANLCSAYLSHADLDYAILTNVKHDKYTTWPEGFNKSRLSS